MKKLTSLFLVLTVFIGLTGCGGSTASFDTQVIKNDEMKVSFEIPKSWKATNGSSNMYSKGGELKDTQSYVVVLSGQSMQKDKDSAIKYLKSNLTKEQQKDAKSGTVKSDIGEFAYITYDDSTTYGKIKAKITSYILISEKRSILITSLQDKDYDEKIKADQVIEHLVSSIKDIK